MTLRRARTDEEKNERKDAIYNAAYKLFKEQGYDGVSLNGIASEAKFTKSNMYRYFSSKEEIFLNVFSHLFEHWVDDCTKRLKKLKRNTTSSSFAKTWTKSLISHQEFLDLTPLLFISLEKNSSFDELIRFKRFSMNLLYTIALEISRIYPNVTNEQAFQFLTISFASMSSYWAATKQSDALIKIYEQDEFKVLKPNFEKNIMVSAEITIRGILNN